MQFKGDALTLKEQFKGDKVSPYFEKHEINMPSLFDFEKNEAAA